MQVVSGESEARTISIKKCREYFRGIFFVTDSLPKPQRAANGTRRRPGMRGGREATNPGRLGGTASAMATDRSTTAAGSTARDTKPPSVASEPDMRAPGHQATGPHAGAKWSASARDSTPRFSTTVDGDPFAPETAQGSASTLQAPRVLEQQAAHPRATADMLGLRSIPGSARRRTVSRDSVPMPVPDSMEDLVVRMRRSLNTNNQAVLHYLRQQARRAQRSHDLLVRMSKQHEINQQQYVDLRYKVRRKGGGERERGRVNAGVGGDTHTNAEVEREREIRRVMSGNKVQVDGERQRRKVRHI